MNLFTLSLRSRLRGFKNTQDHRSLLQFLIFLFFSILVLLAIYVAMDRLLFKLDELNSKEQYSAIIGFASQWVPVGNLLKERFLSMILVAFFFMLIFSNTISSLSYMFLAQDTELLLKSPVKHFDLFRLRFFESGLYSSWMSLFFFLPVFIAYYINYGSKISYLWNFLLIMIPFLIIPASIGSLTALFVAAFFPVEHARKIFNFLFIFFLTALIVLIRIMQPERLFMIRQYTEIQAFIDNLRIPFSEYLPSTWLSNVIMSLLTGKPSAAVEPGLWLFGTAFLLLLTTMIIGKKYYYTAWVRTQEQKTAPVINDEPIRRHLKLNFLPPVFRAVFIKDLMLFFRNPELWSQIFLIFAMVGLFFYNLHLLHLDRFELYSKILSRFVSVLCTAFVGFITTSISMRFLFPAISLEGPAFWILRKSPFQFQKIILYKLLFFLPWVIFIGNIMVLISNWLLSVPGLYYLLNGFNITVICIVNSVLAISFGTIYPNYRAENINKIFMSFGGTFFMLSSLSFMFIFFISQAPTGYIFYVLRVKQGFLSPRHFIAAAIFAVIGIFSTWAFCRIPYKKAQNCLRKLESI